MEPVAITFMARRMSGQGADYLVALLADIEEMHSRQAMGPREGWFEPRRLRDRLVGGVDFVRRAGFDPSYDHECLGDTGAAVRPSTGRWPVMVGMEEMGMEMWSMWIMEEMEKMEKKMDKEMETD